ncbi:SAP domain-containing protein [Macrococcoides canis]|uniref:SAP domain-containing protein n=1 Tax=Macrococcoides canis TaxID=1855823 RepID=UPI0020B7E534|nr:SAP domain-containing protein [Macrococcus canis]UTH10814.1 SAP domain-containing protein [Macrococcus canis]
MRKLTAFELLVMHLINGKSKGTVLEQNFWTDIYSVNPMKILKKLIDDGIIIEKSDLNLTLTKLKNPELKELLKANKLKLTGNKTELVSRLIENDADLSNVYLPEVYVINEEYHKVFEDTVFLKDFTYGIDVTLDDAYQYYLRHPDKSELEIKSGTYIDRLKYWMNSNEHMAVYQLRTLNSTLARIYFQYQENEQGFYYLNCYNLISIILDFRNYIEYHEYNHRHLNASVSQTDLIKYRSALSNKQFTLSQLECNLENSIKPYNFSKKIKDRAIQFMMAFIQDEFVDPKMFVKGLTRRDFNKDEANNQRIKIELNVNEDEEYFPIRKVSENKVKKKKRFWLF